VSLNFAPPLDGLIGGIKGVNFLYFGGSSGVSIRSTSKSSSTSIGEGVLGFSTTFFFFFFFYTGGG